MAVNLGFRELRDFFDVRRHGGVENTANSGGKSEAGNAGGGDNLVARAVVV
jgi:hypothetical protein